MRLKEFERAVVKKAYPDQGVRMGDVVVLLDRVEANGKIVWWVESVSGADPHIVAAIDEEDLEPDLEAWANRKTDEIHPDDAEGVDADELADRVCKMRGIERPIRRKVAEGKTNEGLPIFDLPDDRGIGKR